METKNLPSCADKKCYCKLSKLGTRMSGDTFSGHFSLFRTTLSGTITPPPHLFAERGISVKTGGWWEGKNGRASSVKKKEPLKVEKYVVVGKYM